jgi:nucleoside diphosphate kinase
MPNKITSSIRTSVSKSCMTVRSAHNATQFIMGGRWRWVARAEGAVEELCAACRRINDKFPAGVVTLRGDFDREHREEMIHLARHQEAAEKEEHPLNRIISIEDDAHGVVINTTDIHLPRRIGEAVKRAFHGEIEDHFEKDGYFVRVTWSREA